jgi:Mlc titration factor MtfA (ptsG expression regulator)
MAACVIADLQSATFCYSPAMLSLFRQYRRRKLLRTAFPPHWEEILRRNVPQAQYLTPDQASRFRDNLRIFVAEKNWEGCGGFEMTDEARVTIAALVCLMVIELQPPTLFERILSVLVYPTAYRAPNVSVLPGGILNESGQPRLGEAWWQGPVILSWEDVLAGGRMEANGRNLVFHEFAHQLDMLNGRHVDGLPPMQTEQQLQRWSHVMGTEYHALVARCRQGRPGIIDCYGTTSPGEFFAVTTESFFCDAVSLQRFHQPLYEVLREYYGVDPAAWDTTN